jgi:hypothetical protein
MLRQHCLARSASAIPLPAGALTSSCGTGMAGLGGARCEDRYASPCLHRSMVAGELASPSTCRCIAAARRHDVMVTDQSAGNWKESVSLDVKRAFPFGLYGRSRPGRTASSTAVPCVLLTRKRSQVQTLSRPPLFSLVKDLSAPSGQRSSRTAAALRPQAAPHRTKWALRSWTARDHHEPTDHSAWSPPPGPGPSQAPRRRPPRTPAGPVSTCSSQAPPPPGRHPARRPGGAEPGSGQAAALGYGRPSCEPRTANVAPSLPVRPDAGRRPRRPRTTAARRPAAPQPRGGSPHRATPGPSATRTARQRRGQRRPVRPDT